MLEIRPTCEHCNTALPNTSTEAMICSFECTYCKTCASSLFNNVCPSCAGNFVERPIRTSEMIAKYPASTKVVFKPKDFENTKKSPFKVMKRSIEIRRANLTDAVSISLLGRVTYTQSHGSYIENKKDLIDFYNDSYAVSKIRTELKDAKNLYWIVFSDELPVGFAKILLNINPPNSQELNSCKLEKIYILEDFIGYKIGTKLQEALLEAVTQLHFKSIWLAVYYKNTKGIKFYQKHGFKEAGNIDFVVGEISYRNLILLKKL